jgi:putative transcriptional regulator
MDSLKGQILVAQPTLPDPNFSRSVVLVAHHDAEGALGLVLNRPSETTVAEAAPELSPLCGEGALVHYGGPVARQGVVVLAEFEQPQAAGLLVAGDLGLVGPDSDLESLPGQVRRARVFAGHSGWGPGQLDHELEAEGWIVAPLARDDVFAAATAGLWRTVLARKGGRYALAARMPTDPSLN